MKTALIVAPHPDDAELGMGGTIAKMETGGWNVTVVDLTDGEPTPFGSKQIRAKETKTASDILGIKKRICLGMPNRSLDPTLENRRKLAEVIRLRNKPFIVLVCMSLVQVIPKNTHMARQVAEDIKRFIYNFAECTYQIRSHDHRHEIGHLTFEFDVP